MALYRLLDCIRMTKIPYWFHADECYPTSVLQSVSCGVWVNMHGYVCALACVQMRCELKCLIMGCSERTGEVTFSSLISQCLTSVPASLPSISLQKLPTFHQLAFISLLLDVITLVCFVSILSLCIGLFTLCKALCTWMQPYLWIIIGHESDTPKLVYAEPFTKDLHLLMWREEDLLGYLSFTWCGKQLLAGSEWVRSWRAVQRQLMGFY